MVDVYDKKDCNDILVPSVTIIHLHCGPWCGAMGVVVESVIAKFKSFSARCEWNNYCANNLK